MSEEETRAKPAARSGVPRHQGDREFLRTPLYMGGGEPAHERLRRRARRRLRSEATGATLLAVLLALLLAPALAPETADAGGNGNRPGVTAGSSAAYSGNPATRYASAAGSGSGGSSAPSGGGEAGASGGNGEAEASKGTSKAEGDNGATVGTEGDNGTTTGPEGGSSSSSAGSTTEGDKSLGGVVALLGGKATSAGERSSSLGGLSHVRQAATGIGPLRGKLTHQMGIAGSASGAYVYDITAGEPLFALHSTQLRAPASVEKLYTATAALMTMGASARLETRVLSTGHLGANGVFEGNLYLYGGGDPTFGSGSFITSHYGGKGTSVSTLAEDLKRMGVRRVDGDIEGDDSYFDFLRGDPSSGYAPDIWLEGTLSGLAFNRGEYGSLSGQHALAAYAALQLAQALKQAGIQIDGHSGAALAPAGANTLAIARSPRLSVLLHLMLPPSDNFFAETLVKDLGARYGGAGTTKAGMGIVRGEIAKLGLHPQIVDGSGLDRADHTSPEQVVKLLQTLADTYDGGILREDLAVAGESGTLEERMKDSYAEGRCKAKTGTLTGVSNLAGYCEAADGHLLAFAFFDDVIPTYTAHVIQDAMAETIADY
ncbi:MAG TPA: D-alanyl-D-alanine carboxypeptidase/D-alanyl-D-alanine-endopeptidase [Solirubrobacteraceae bacterium]